MGTFQVVGAMLSDTGRVREHNEDSIAYILPQAHTPGPSLIVVADGMGGHAAGEIASRIAADTITNAFFASNNSIGQRLASSFAEANAAILRHAAEQPHTAGMGTTCTVLAIDDSGAWLAHVGDSRAYLVRGADISQISEEHSWVAEMVRKGVMSEDEAAASTDRNVILRAMGIADTLEPQVWAEPMPVRLGDTFVLCSDGLSDLIPPGQIKPVVDHASPEIACRTLVDMALAAGGHDNISVGVFTIAEPPTPTAPRISPDTREIERPLTTP